MVWVGVIALVIDVTTAFAEGWLPNVAIAAWSIAITITVVESIVKGEEHAQREPRSQRVQITVDSAFRDFVSAVASDYRYHHFRTFVAVPSDARKMLHHWLKGIPTEDVPRSPDEAKRESRLADDAEKLARILGDCRARDLDVLEPVRVAAIDDFVRLVERNSSELRLVAKEFDRGLLTHEEAGSQERDLLQSLVTSAAALAEHVPTDGIQIDADFYNGLGPSTAWFETLIYGPYLLTRTDEIPWEQLAERASALIERSITPVQLNYFFLRRFTSEDQAIFARFLTGEVEPEAPPAPHC